MDLKIFEQRLYQQRQNGYDRTIVPDVLQFMDEHKSQENFPLSLVSEFSNCFLKLLIGKVGGEKTFSMEEVQWAANFSGSGLDIIVLKETAGELSPEVKARATYSFACDADLNYYLAGLCSDEEKIDYLKRTYDNRGESARRAEGIDEKHCAHQWRLRGTVAEELADLMTGKREKAGWLEKAGQDSEEALKRKEFMEGHHINYILHRQVEVYFKLFELMQNSRYRKKAERACERYFAYIERNVPERNDLYSRVRHIKNLLDGIRRRPKKNQSYDHGGFDKRKKLIKKKRQGKSRRRRFS